MTKKARKNRKLKRVERELKEKDKGFFGILFFLVSIYISIIVGAYSIIREISLKTQLENVFPENIISLVLLGVILVVGLYLLLSLLIGVLEFSSYYYVLNSKQLKISRELRKFILCSPGSIITIGFSLGGFLLMLLIVYFNPTYAIITGTFYFISWIFFAIYFKKPKGFISSITIKKPKPTWKTYLILIWILVLILLVVHLAFGVTIFNLAKFDVNLDKELYHPNESAYITIYSKGIVRPIPYNLTYSNLGKELNYIKHQAYGLAPIYTKIDAENLTEYPYNSYIQIYYNLPEYYRNFLFIRENLTQSEFIPVINS
ncbi:hypothetical protein M0R72_04260 [Candidatus Pacearchaeota archaeon]|jgi:hypothetical protein|nr:hypothetical protein [Candidatus Pacearchaeota archaeon]